MRDNHAPILFDVTRLVWRRWAGLRPTGIDRICLAWLAHYGSQSQAVIIHRYGQAILPFGPSQALFHLLGRPEQPSIRLARFRAALAGLAIRRSIQLIGRLDGRGRPWLNPGHTGLDAGGIAVWCRQCNIRPIHFVHDLIPLTHPQFCRDGEDARHLRRMRTVLDTASGVVANSQHTLDSLRDFADQQGRPLPPAIVAWPGTPLLPEISVETSADPSFVILGTIEGRKNHKLLLTIWDRMIQTSGDATPRLVIIGRRGWQAEDVFAWLDSDRLAGAVVETGPLDDAGIARALANARALLFPSYAEGFGIPLVEALAAGTPVIASDLPVFREIGQGVPDLLPLNDLMAWQATILDYARPESAQRAAQIARIKSFRAPDWPTHFRHIDRLLAEIGA